ncbi:P-loop containing nucleoside triphosphate hydrolase domain-containing protein [Rozella allomycis CSF55]|uniref:DNA repair protein RAD50 n=1 Tax=Rozella allomycis (strain CSF55) TaxID=988480 RepID=A0A075AZF9_ROZAC|nr:P-loop containing nucleoside triphosphate hydrolase domain-containing protein [Rozella allomycis CSF55]|eukprot:EPZ35695.1 P-loop containing nucleoside triphosphate hydrolase domain-containing protein [Rozella allomycis CSF55]
MSSIEKLSIQGIRSFSPQQPSVIEFYTPLTLIVGLNGSGKTTIIECLKYATTGELPPNSKGGAFIHDPKVTDHCDVKAQIKLKFKNLNQQQLVLIRSLQSTQKKVKLEMKTLEALLTFRDPQTNQKMTLSSRCADFDAEIPMHMGVSAAILENVIFCHQEDSLWPLSEPAVLKRKFDDIFAATRYAKALDAIKSVSKGIKGEIQVEKVKLDHFMEKNEKAEKIQIGMEGIKRKIESIGGRNEEIEGRLIEARRELEDMNKEMNEAMILQQKIESVQNEERMVERNKEELESTLQKVYNESDEELEKRLSNLRESVLEARRSVEEMEIEKSEIEQENKRLNEKKNEYFQQKGEISGMIQMQKEREKKMKEMIYEISERLPEVKDEECDNVIKMIEEEIERNGKSSERNKNEFYESEREVQREIGQIEAMQGSMNEIKREKKKNMERFQEKMNENEREMNLIKVDEVEYVEIGKRLKEKQSELEMVKQGFETVEIEKEIRKIEEMNLIKVDEVEYVEIGKRMKEKQSELEMVKQGFETVEIEKEIRKIEFENKEIEEKMKQTSFNLNLISKKTEKVAKLEVKKRERQEKHLEIQTLTEKSEFILKFGTFPVYENLEFESRENKRKIEKEFLKIENELKEKNYEISGKITTKDLIEENLKNRREEFRKCKNKIENIINEFENKNILDISKTLTIDLDDLSSDEIVLNFDKEFKNVLRNVEENVEELRNELTNGDSMRISFQKFIKEFELKKDCPLCSRKFNNLKEENCFENKLKNFILNLPSNLVLKQREFESQNNLLNKLKLNSHLIPKIKDLFSLIKKDLLDLEKIKKEIFNLKDEISEIDLKCLEKKKELETISNLVKDCELIFKRFNEIKNLEKEIQNLNLDLSQGIPWSLEELNESFNKSKNSFDENNKKINKLNLELRDKIKLISNLESLINKDQSSLNSIKVQLEKKNNLKLENSNLSIQINLIQNELNDLLQKQIEFEPNLLKLKQKKNEITSDYSLKQQEINNQINFYSKHLNSLRELKFDCEKFQNSKIDLEISEIEKKVEEINSKIKQNLDKIEEINQKIQFSIQKFRKVDSAERTILDNLRLRNQIKRLNDLKIEIDKLKLEFSKFKFDLNKKNKLESEITNLISQKSVIFGELKQLEIQKNSYSLELKSDYKNVREKYSEQLIKVTSLELSQSDLDKYGKALDSAIMKYHSVKMKEINKIICELWTNTYQGTDIDTVEIRSEKECKGKATFYNLQQVNIILTLDKGNRSYNYRVVMLKGTTELDMRGRSSAGQRVLASIIIRLALAESFGANCGILALDEPTTNLDQANIESLARSLSDIIKTKRQQANFQLIVITHDEEFVRLLGQSDYVDYYWRVARDNNQHSVIERQSITSR